MNSDEDYQLPSGSVGTPSDNKRITRSKTKSKKKIDAKPARKSTTKARTTPAKKPKMSPQREQTSRSFSSSPLTVDELQQLYEKYTRDRHYFLNPSASPAPLVVSRTTDGKVVTTKIECYKQKRYLMRELAATMTLPKTDNNEHALLDGGNDPSAVIFSTPLPDTCSMTFDSNPTCTPYLRSEDTSANGKKKKERGEPCQNSALRAQSVFGPGNDLWENPINFNSLAKPFTTNSLQNVSEIPSSSSAFTSVAPAHLKLRPTSSTWNSPEQSNSSVGNQNGSSASEFYTPIGNTWQIGYTANVANRSSCKSQDYPYSNLCNPSSLTIDDRYNSNGTSLNPRDSVCLPHNHSSAGNLPSNWNYAGQISSDTFAAYNSTAISSNSINESAMSSVNAQQPNIVAYNAEVTSFNNRIYAIPANTCGPTGNSGNASEYCSSSFMSWNGLTVLPKSFSSMNESYNNLCGGQNPAGAYDASERGRFDNSTNEINAWSESQQSNNDCFFPNSNYDATEQSIGNFPVITDLDDDLALTSSAQPARENFCSVQDNDLDPSASSVYLYDDDIVYENWHENADRNDENIVSSTQNGGFFSNLLMSVRNEVRPLFDGECNYSQANNNSSKGVTASVFYDFDNEEEKIDTSDCIAEMSRY